MPAPQAGVSLGLTDEIVAKFPVWWHKLQATPQPAPAPAPAPAPEAAPEAEAEAEA